MKHARAFLSRQAAATLKDWDFTSMIYARLKACVCVPNKQMHMREPQSSAQQISRLCLLPTAALSPLSHEMYQRRNPESSLEEAFVHAYAAAVDHIFCSSHRIKRERPALCTSRKQRRQRDFILKAHTRTCSREAHWPAPHQNKLESGVKASSPSSELQR